MRSRSLGHGVVARYGIRSKQHSDCSHRGGVGRGKPCLSDARRSSSAQHAYMRLPTDSTARRASTRRHCHACSISTDQPARVALVARTAVLDLAARSEVHQRRGELKSRRTLRCGAVVAILKSTAATKSANAAAARGHGKRDALRDLERLLECGRCAGCRFRVVKRAWRCAQSQSGRSIANENYLTHIISPR